MPDISYNTLKEKFLDKGYSLEFHYLVCPAPAFDPCCNTLSLIPRDKALEIWQESVKKVYGKEWEEWDIWIDHQKHK